MNDEPRPAESKLPIWAQTEMRQLRERVATLEHAAAIAGGGLPDSDVIVDPHMHRIGLGQPDAIGWDLAGGGHFDMQLDRGTGRLKVMASSRLAIYPHVSNSISLADVPLGTA